jgi:hypothetical protein
MHLKPFVVLGFSVAKFSAFNFDDGGKLALPTKFPFGGSTNAGKFTKLSSTNNTVGFGVLAGFHLSPSLIIYLRWQLPLPNSHSCPNVVDGKAQCELS